jgi:hypothetical protein
MVELNVLKRQHGQQEIKRRRVSNLEYSTIIFEENKGKQYWYILAGKYQVQGCSDSLESAESDAHKALNIIPANGTVHSIYKNGKKVKPVNANN